MDSSATSEEEEEYDAKQIFDLFEKDQRPSTSRYMSSSSESILKSSNTALQQSSASGSEKLTLDEIQVPEAKATSEEEEESGAQQPSTSLYMLPSLSVPRSLKRSNTELQQSSASELEKSTLEEIKVSRKEGQMISSASSDERSSNKQERDVDEIFQAKDRLPSTLKCESSTITRERSSKRLLDKTISAAKEKDATAELLIDRVKKYKDPRIPLYINNLKFFIPFALSYNGLCLRESDVYEIINNDANICRLVTTIDEDKFHQMRDKWEKIHGRKLTLEMFRKFINKYEDAVLLTRAQYFLRDVEEFKKFALSPNGLGLRESDVHDIIEDDAILNQEKIYRMKEKWTMEKVFDGERFDNCMIRYCAESHIIHPWGEWRLWIPGLKEIYTHQETYPIYGEELRGESCIPISIWFVHDNDENKERVKKLENIQNHNNVVPFVQLAIYEGYLCIAMEHQSPETLEDIFHDQFNERVSIDLCLQLLQGLNFLHENDIAHCNLTPQTIFVSKDRRNLKLSGYHSIFPSDDNLLLDDSLLDDIYNAPEYVSNKTISDKMNVYTAGKIITKILTNGRYPESQIRPESTLDIDQPELDAGYFLVSNKLLLQELIQQLCNPDPDSRPTAIEALRDFTFFAYKTLYDTAL